MPTALIADQRRIASQIQHGLGRGKAAMRVIGNLSGVIFVADADIATQLQPARKPEKCDNGHKRDRRTHHHIHDGLGRSISIICPIELRS